MQERRRERGRRNPPRSGVEHEEQPARERVGGCEAAPGRLVALETAALGLLVGISAALVAMFAGVSVLRMTYRFELEWHEGLIVDYAWRIAHGLPIYGPPDRTLATGWMLFGAAALAGGRRRKRAHHGARSRP
jgi:hypothetical protein